MSLTMTDRRKMEILRALFLAVAFLKCAEGRSALAKDDQSTTDLKCTLDSFLLRVKQSACTCACDGSPVSTTTVTEAISSGTTPMPPSQFASCSYSTEIAPDISVDHSTDRRDCMQGPAPWNIEQACWDKGCIWEPSRNPDGSSTGAPWCFYPISPNPGTGFKATGCAVAGNTATYQLQSTRAGQTYSTPWGRVAVTVQPMGNSVLRIKFYDASASRYEVPVPLNSPQDGATDPEYDVRIYNTDQSFYLKVVRRSSGAVLFDTSLGGLILEDQFLQIKTRVNSDRVFGFGENRHRTFKHNLNAGAVPMWATDEPPSFEHFNNYGFHPYYMVVESDTKAHGVLLLNSNGMEYKFAPGPTLTLKNIGGILDFYFVLGDSAEDLTQKYTGLVGRPFLPPYWSLGFQLSRWGYNNLPRLKSIVKRNRDAGVPQDVQTLDIDYMRSRQNFRVDFDQFAGLEDYVREMKADGIRTVIILDPAMHADSATKHPTDAPYTPYTNGAEQDVYIKWPLNEVNNMDRINVGPNGVLLGKMWPDGRSAFPDFFTNRTRQWWIDEIKKQHETLEFDGLWIDMNEPAAFGTNTNGWGQWFCSGALPGNHDCMGLRCPVNNWEHPPYIGRIGGGSLSHKTLCASVEQECRPGQMCKHYDVHNLYGWSQGEPTFAANLESTGSRPFVISRSTYPGSGKHVGHWLGDNGAAWGDLQYSIVGMLDFNIFGIPYIGADICGFFLEPSEELCARWQQVGAFYPYSRNHNGNNWKDQDPAQWPLVASIAKKALEMRYRLLPYLYTLFFHAHVHGNTVVRPLHHEFAMESRAYNVNDQFLWGSGLMIAPVVEEGRVSRSVYFPDATWYTYTGQAVAARKEAVEVPMPLDHVGVYFRGGRIIPAQGAGINTEASRKNPFEFIVALDQDQTAIGDLYWDDGESAEPIARQDYLTAFMDFSIIQSDNSAAHFNYWISHADATPTNVQIGEVNIFGLHFLYTTVVMSNGAAATVSTENGVTTVRFQATLNKSFSFNLY